MILDSFQYSGIGGRSENQDAVGSLTEGENGLFVVADGLGGHQAGHLASQCAVYTLKKLWQPETPQTPESLAALFGTVNDAILAV